MQLRSNGGEVGSIRVVLKKHRLWGRLQPDVSLPKVRNEDVGKALSSDEETDLLRACAASRSRSLFSAVALDLCTGLRLTELRLLQWKQINFQTRTLRVGKSKTEYGDYRQIALNDRALTILRAWAESFPQRRPEHYLFPSEKYGQSGPYDTDVTRPINSWKEAWEAAKIRAGVTCRFHDLRHTVVTRLLEAGVPINTVAAIMGWSGSTMVLMSKRYGHIGPATRAEAMQRLENGSGQEWLQNLIQSGDLATGTIQ